MNRVTRRHVFAASALLACVFAAAPLFSAETWKAGAATANITPQEYMPMAGYAGRGAKHASEKLTDLWAKALVLQDGEGHRAALVTLDIIGMDRALSQSICQELEKQFGLKRHQVALSTSHTHTGPVVAKNLRPMHYMMLDDRDRQLVDNYANFLQKQIVAAVGEAIKETADAHVSWASGTATFAVNRRNNSESNVPQLRQEKKLRGPFDHDVPVLAVRGDDEKLIAAVFGYACHCTVLSSFQWSGDYAAFAQLEVEKTHPGCVAMFWAGCGGDQNPLPRRKVELAKDYGRQLGEAVSAVLGEDMAPLPPTLETTYAEIDLPLAKLPTREQLQQDTESKNKYIAARARHLLKQVESGEALSQTYPYPVASWRLGKNVHMLFLGGEVVVDYALRLKEELGDEKLQRKNIWVAGYANDVMAYIPSRRVLREGGYEGGGAMIYYGLPTVWAPEVEEVIVKEVIRQLK